MLRWFGQDLLWIYGRRLFIRNHYSLVALDKGCYGDLDSFMLFQHHVGKLEL